MYLWLVGELCIYEMQWMMSSPVFFLVRPCRFVKSLYACEDPWRCGEPQISALESDLEIVRELLMRIDTFKRLWLGDSR
jgi:hypothetical protein